MTMEQLTKDAIEVTQYVLRQPLASRNLPGTPTFRATQSILDFQSPCTDSDGT